MLQLGVGADSSQEFHLLFDIRTCQLSRHYCMIGREKNTLRAESPSYYREQPVDTATQVGKCSLCMFAKRACLCAGVCEMQDSPGEGMAAEY